MPVAPDPTFSADSDVLYGQADLHSRIAQFYRDLVDQIPAQGAAIIHEFNSTGHADWADGYQPFLNSVGSDWLTKEAGIHQSWADYFSNLADQVRQAEVALSGYRYHPGRAQ